MHSLWVYKHLFGSLILILSSIYPALGFLIQKAFLFNFEGLSGHFPQWLYYVTFAQLKHKPSVFLYPHCHLFVFHLLVLKTTILVGTKEHLL